MATSGKNERVFDQRVVHRYIGTGRVTREEYEEHLASLPDVAENVKARDEGGDEDGYDRPIAAANEPSRRPLGLLPLAQRPSYDDDDDDDDDDLDDEDDDDLDDDDDDDDGDGDGEGDKADTVTPETPDATPPAESDDDDA